MALQTNDGIRGEMPSVYIKKGWTAEARARQAEMSRGNQNCKGKGIVAPVFVRNGVEGKACVECLEWKPLERFARHETCAGGRRNICTTCAGQQAYANNPETCKRSVRYWQKNHPEQYKLIKRAGDRRRHGRKVKGKVSTKQLRALIKQYHGWCVYCFDDADTIDHVIPLSRGGEHTIENLRPACSRCNFAKHTKTAMEWLGLEV